MRGPFNANDSMNEGHPNSFGRPTAARDNFSGAGSYRENAKIAADETFTHYASLKSIEYIHQQFYAQKHSREA